MRLPINNPVHHPALFATGLLEVDAGGLNAVMAHKIRKKSDIRILPQEILREQMPEGIAPA